MQTRQNRRQILATLSSAAAAALIGSERVSAQGAPPEVATIRLAKVPGICIAPQYVAEELLKLEGFSDIQYVEVATRRDPPIRWDRQGRYEHGLYSDLHCRAGLRGADHSPGWSACGVLRAVWEEGRERNPRPQGKNGGGAGAGILAS